MPRLKMPKKPSTVLVVTSPRAYSQPQWLTVSCLANSCRRSDTGGFRPYADATCGMRSAPRIRACSLRSRGHMHSAGLAATLNQADDRALLPRRFGRASVWAALGLATDGMASLALPLIRSSASMTLPSPPSGADRRRPSPRGCGAP